MSASLHFFFSNLLYFSAIFLVYASVHSFVHSLALSQINRHGQQKLVPRLVAQFVRLISKEDRVNHNRAFAMRFFLLLQLWIIVALMMNLGRDNTGQLVGNLMALLALVFASSLANFFHHWAVSNKSSMLAFIKNMEVDLFADLAIVLTIMLALVRYKSISLQQIELAQAALNPLLLAYSGLMLLTGVLLLMIKYRQLPFSRKNDQLLSGSLLESHYSGFSQLLMQFIPSAHFSLILLLFILLAAAGGQMHGFQLIPLAQPLTWLMAPLICLGKFLVITLLSSIFGHTLPLVSFSRTKFWLYTLVPALLIVQLLLVLLANFQGF